MNSFNLNFETFQNLDAVPVNIIWTVADSADAIRTHYE